MNKKLYLHNKCTSWLFLVIGLLISFACSSSNPEPTSGSSFAKSKGRLLIASEASSAMQIIDLEQSTLESNSKTFSTASTLTVSPEGQFAFVAQTSGNKVDLLKMGTSTSTTSTTTTSSSTDSHGHSHKARFGAGHDHGTESSASSTDSSSTSSSTSTSSVTELDLSITGAGLKRVVAKGQWIAVQFNNEVIALSEETLESNINSLTQTPFNRLTTTFPGIPLDEEHMALAGNVIEISDGTVVSAGGNASANLLVSDNILSATRSQEGTGLYGTDQGVLVVAKHTESGNTVWEDFMVAYPEIPENQIFLAGEHDHEGEEESHTEGEDEHKEVEENRVIREWATNDALGHAFAHFTHENHSAGIYLFEVGEETGTWTYLDGTSNSLTRPVAMEIAQITNSDNSKSYHLLVLMSNGNLRIYDAKDEGKFLRTITGLTTALSDFHAGEGNYPGLAAGLNKAYIGDPSNNYIHQFNLTTFQTELTWVVSNKPNELLFLGESTLSESSSSTHSHD